MLLVIAISIFGLFLISICVCCYKKNPLRRNSYQYKTYSVNSTFENSMKVIDRFESGGNSNYESLDGSRENSVDRTLAGNGIN